MYDEHGGILPPNPPYLLASSRAPEPLRGAMDGICAPLENRMRP